MPPSRMVDKAYTGSWRGQQFTAQMRWPLADEPQIVQRGRGTITMSGGQKFPIEGWQPSADAAEFNVKPNASDETYKTTKTTRDGSEAWRAAR